MCTCVIASAAETCAFAITPRGPLSPGERAVPKSCDDLPASNVRVLTCLPAAENSWECAGGAARSPPACPGRPSGLVFSLRGVTPELLLPHRLAPRCCLRCKHGQTRDRRGRGQSRAAGRAGWLEQEYSTRLRSDSRRTRRDSVRKHQGRALFLTARNPGNGVSTVETRDLFTPFAHGKSWGVCVALGADVSTSDQRAS